MASLRFVTDFGTARLSVDAVAKHRRLVVPEDDALFAGLAAIRVEAFEVNFEAGANVALRFEFEPAPGSTAGPDGAQHLHALHLQRGKMTAHVGIAGDDWWEDIQSVACTTKRSGNHGLHYELHSDRNRTLEIRMAFAAAKLTDPNNIKTWTAVDSLLTMEMNHA